MINPIDSMWTEKYRPKVLVDMVGDFKNKIEKYLEHPEKMQHLLLYSLTAGTGKTTLAKVIANSLDADTLLLNSSDDRKIETIREKVNGFVKTKSAKIGTRRVVILDEADGLTAAAQDALRHLMEAFASNALFILTCNNKHKVISALQSRCAPIPFSNPDKKEILKYLIDICEKETLEYTPEGLQQIIDREYPSIRNCVQVLQSLHTEGKSVSVTESKASDEEFQNLWVIIKEQKDWKMVKNYLLANTVDVVQLNTFFWFKAVEEDFIKMMQITDSNAKRFDGGGEPLIPFVTSLIDMIK